MPDTPAPLPLHLLQRLAGTAEMRRMDAHASETLGLPGRILMENAARAVADRVQALLVEAGPAAPVVVCCGSGNNGGDGYAAARLLANRGLPVTVVALAPPGTPDAQANAQAWTHFGDTVSWTAQRPAAEICLDGAGLVVDALFGTGLTRPLAGDAAALVAAVNRAGEARPRPVVGVDVPSGVDGDTGRELGEAVRCSHTVSLQAGKPGCHQYPGAACAGRVEVADISVPARWEPGQPGTYLLTPDFLRALLPPRPPDGHKGTFGHLLAVCGSAGMGGAAMLAGLAGLKSGAGLVTVGVPRALRDRFITAAPELMTLAPPTGEEGAFAEAQAPFMIAAANERSAAVLGCGLGRRKETAGFVRRLAAGVEVPLLIDADGLFHLAPKHLQTRPAPTVITPHPGELARLGGLGRDALAADRIGEARRLAGEWGVVLVLKGAATVVAAPGGDAFINPTGDVGLASGGTGDVLSGMIGGWLAQGLAPLPAALLGVYLHGLARDCLRETVTVPYFSAADLIAGIDPALRALGSE
jgi:NAD(P)H-hydrate epimerase